MLVDSWINPRNCAIEFLSIKLETKIHSSRHSNLYPPKYTRRERIWKRKSDRDRETEWHFLFLRYSSYKPTGSDRYIHIYRETNPHPHTPHTLNNIGLWFSFLLKCRQETQEKSPSLVYYIINAFLPKGDCKIWFVNLPRWSFICIIYVHTHLKIHGCQEQNSILTPSNLKITYRHSHHW